MSCLGELTILSMQMGWGFLVHGSYSCMPGPALVHGSCVRERFECKLCFLLSPAHRHGGERQARTEGPGRTIARGCNSLVCAVRAFVARTRHLVARASGHGGGRLVASTGGHVGVSFVARTTGHGCISLCASAPIRPGNRLCVDNRGRLLYHL